MNQIQGKVWGQTEPLFNKNNVEIHRIEIDAGGFCSKHKHDYKYNAFFVEQGELLVKTYKNDYDLVDETIVQKGQMTIAKPKEFHSFEAMTDVIAYEIYWVELDENDIVRESVGGAKK